MSIQIENERRFLCDELPQGASAAFEQHQSYLIAAESLEVRVRTSTAEVTGTRRHQVAMKIGLSHSRRLEFEFEIARSIAEYLHRRSRATVRKTRHLIGAAEGEWEVDVYHGDLQGLITAEFEGPESTDLKIPEWVSVEVTGDTRYSNRRLATRGVPDVVSVPVLTSDSTVEPMSNSSPAHNVVRATAAITTLVLAVAVVALQSSPTLATLLLVVQTVVFTVGWVRPRMHPYRAIARTIAKLFGDDTPEHPLPVRFASLVGSLFTVLALTLALFGLTAGATLITSTAMAAAAANAFADWCVACLLYPRVRAVVEPLLRVV
jgi:adenylate cyclase